MVASARKGARWGIDTQERQRVSRSRREGTRISLESREGRRKETRRTRRFYRQTPLGESFFVAPTIPARRALPLPLVFAPPLLFPPDNLDSRLAAILAALFAPNMTGAGVVGCIPARAAAPEPADGSVERRRFVGGMSETRGRREGLRGERRALPGG